MKKYVIPQIELLFFDEIEVVEISTATYSDKLLQQYTFGKDGHGDGVGVNSSISVKLQDINTQNLNQ